LNRVTSATLRSVAIPTKDDPLTQLTDPVAVDDANDIVDATTPIEEDSWLANEDAVAPEDAAEPDEPEEEPEEPEAPAIQPPASWSKEDKAAFAAMPPEAQEIVTRRETERDRFLQSKAQEAAQTRSQVENEARAAVAQLSQQAASQLQQYAEQFVPQRPDPAMLQYDPQGFYAAQGQYEATLAQRQQAQQQAAQYEQQAMAHNEAIRQAEHQSEIATLRDQFPEWSDPEKGPAYQQKLTSVGLELGYSAAHLNEARAIDILAMRKVSEITAERDSLKAQLDTLNKAKMVNVRAAKDLPRVTKAGAPQPASVSSKAEMAELRASMQRGNRGAADRAFERFV
jgi:hypothetical protein